MSKSEQVKTIVVFGATGQQGSALVEALAKHNTPSQRYTIYALSRSTSPKSTHLASLPGVEVVQVAQNYMDAPNEVFQQLELGHGGVHGVFSVQGYVSEAVELKQGRAIIDAAKENGVKHFVYSSADFGGLEDTGSPAFEVKRTVENYLIASGMPYTSLRVTQFMDNLLPTSHFMFKISRTILLRQTYYEHPERKHQLVATRDIGRFAAVAFNDFDAYANKAIGLAGWEGTVADIEQVYREVMGSEVTLTYWVLGAFVKRVSHLGAMSKFFDDHGFRVDIPFVKRAMPELEDLREFLQRYKASHP